MVELSLKNWKKIVFDNRKSGSIRPPQSSGVISRISSAVIPRLHRHRTHLSHSWVCVFSLASSKSVGGGRVARSRTISICWRDARRFGMEPRERSREKVVRVCSARGRGRRESKRVCIPSQDDIRTWYTTQKRDREETQRRGRAGRVAIGGC